MVQTEQPEEAFSQSDISEGGVVQMSVNAARDLQFRPIDIETLVPRRQEACAGQTRSE